MKTRTMLTVAIVLSSAIPAPMPARAVVVDCVNCSTWVQDLLGYARQGEQLAQEAAQLKTQLAQYANMLTNIASLPQMALADVQSNIMQVRQIANAASLLSGNAGSAMARLSSAQGYVGRALETPGQIQARFQGWQQMIGNASDSLGRTLGVQQGQEQNYIAVQLAAQEHLRTAEGQKQAIQAAGELAALTNTQLQQIQTTLTATAQMQGADILARADRTAAEDAITNEALRYRPRPTTGNKEY